jgi:hypothetical protein
MMRIAISWIAIFSFGLSYPCGTFAQSRNVAPERWQAVDKSMSDLLLEGYRPVSVIAPSSHLRIYFLSSGSLLAKCTEEAALTRPPPPPPQAPPSAQQSASAQFPPSAQQPVSAQFPPPAQGAAAAAPGNFTPEIGVTFECARLSKSR